jgi:hypothetical protein
MVMQAGRSCGAATGRNETHLHDAQAYSSTPTGRTSLKAIFAWNEGTDD